MAGQMETVESFEVRTLADTEQLARKLPSLVLELHTVEIPEPQA
jgi:hypothetical protein